MGPCRAGIVGRWWDGQDAIDIVGVRDSTVTLVGECKWSARPVDERVLVRLQHKAHKLELAAEPFWVLASRSGFTNGLSERAQRGDVLLISPEDLYTDCEPTEPA